MKSSRLLLLLPFILCPLTAFAQAAPEAAPLIAKAVEAAGGEEKLPRLFRIKEQFHAGANPVPAGKPQSRTSVLEPPAYWWLGTKDRTGEPAKFDVWAWTLLALLDSKNQVEVIPDVTEAEQPAFGLRITGGITPAMDLYFNREDSRLVRMDWRNDIYRFSEFKEHDGFKYPSKTILFRRKSGEPWFYHEILELERLSELPAGITR